MKKGIICIILMAAMLLSLAACGKMKDMDGGMNMAPEASMDNSTVGGTPGDAEAGSFIENEFIYTKDENVSTFSADVDTASYAYFRRLVEAGYSLSELIATAGNSIRTEEMINYFNYNYPEPEDNELFSTTSQIAPCPWNSDAMLFVLGLQADKIELASKNNLVFLIDVSGSMNSSDKLGLIKRAFSYLVDKLGDDDTVSIVTYAGEEKVVLEGCKGSKKDKIMKAVNSLGASGSTNGEAGLKKAYQIAEAYYIPDGNNRIIMASDGDLNVGMSSVEEIKAFVTEKKNNGVFMSVLGFGTGNYMDNIMETIADCGNGVYYYIDSEREAEKVFGTDIFSTLYTVAKDVKLQLTFNTEYIDAYRLVGYENRVLANEDFENDNKDAGDLGAGHSVTVCYEVVFKEDVTIEDGDLVIGLDVRYKQPNGEKSMLEQYSFTKEIITETPSDDLKFICAVIETSMIIHRSKYIGEITLENVKETLDGLTLSDVYRKEFRSLINKLINN
jgi:Ca-activated chloride channel family protein